MKKTLGGLIVIDVHVLCFHRDQQKVVSIVDLYKMPSKKMRLANPETSDEESEEMTSDAEVLRSTVQLNRFLCIPHHPKYFCDIYLISTITLQQYHLSELC